KLWERPAERHGDVYNPATGEKSGRVAFASPAVVDAAVASSTAALQTAGDTPDSRAAEGA
ncbi:MAG TPA: hypothetical protein VFL59_00975, partial [Candidatus Nanopelagicales bacterium]|nr:hypothetical protein [Candidatus Nanopelagicales bacterium]